MISNCTLHMSLENLTIKRLSSPWAATEAGLSSTLPLLSCISPFPYRSYYCDPIFWGPDQRCKNSQGMKLFPQNACMEKQAWGKVRWVLPVCALEGSMDWVKVLPEASWPEHSFQSLPEADWGACGPIFSGFKLTRGGWKSSLSCAPCILLEASKMWVWQLPLQASQAVKLPATSL